MVTLALMLAAAPAAAPEFNAAGELVRVVLLLLDADGKRLLIGIGPGGMRTLHVYDGASVELPVVDQPTPASIPAFGELLARWKRGS